MFGVDIFEVFWLEGIVLSLVNCLCLMIVKPAYEPFLYVCLFFSLSLGTMSPFYSVSIFFPEFSLLVAPPCLGPPHSRSRNCLPGSAGTTAPRATSSPLELGGPAVIR